MSRVTTRYLPGLLAADLADDLFLYLKKEIDWEDGIYSKRAKAVSRQGKSINFLEDEKLLPVILLAVEKFGMELPQGVYLNRYRDGTDFAPQHTHKDTVQIVISLGCVRTLNVGKKQYPMQHGDAILFGSSIHGVVAEPSLKKERISIALFCTR